MKVPESQFWELIKSYEVKSKEGQQPDLDNITKTMRAPK
jgi:hypothetical protein